MASLKQEPRRCARGFAQFFRQPALLGLVLGGGVALGATWGLARRLERTLAGSLCGPGYYHAQGCLSGAVLANARVWVPAGELEVPAADFEAAGRSSAEGLKNRQIAGFWADRWEAHDAAETSGQRALRLSLEQASTHCAAWGGRLPSSEEWLRLATYPNRARYPWGDTGLLCRIATWGREAGPCDWRGGDADAVDAPGAHPEGCSPVGVCDLVGNRAEWSADGKLHGGSYASTFAGELRVWSVETPTPGTTPRYAGARCVYDAPR